MRPNSAQANAELWHKAAKTWRHQGVHDVNIESNLIKELISAHTYLFTFFIYYTFFLISFYIVIPKSYKLKKIPKRKITRREYNILSRI